MINEKEYAEALFLLTEEEGTTDAVLAEVQTVSGLLSDNPDYKNLLDTPAVARAEKLGLIDEAFSGMNAATVNLLKILCEGRCVHSFPRIAADYALLCDEARGIERVEAVSAVPMTDTQLSAAAEKLGRLTGKTVVIKNTVDRSIIGGVKLRYSGKQLDGSVKTKLEGFEKALRNTVI